MIIAYNATGAFLSDKIGVISPDFQSHNGASLASANKWCLWYDDDLKNHPDYEKAVKYEQSNA